MVFIHINKNLEGRNNNPIDKLESIMDNLNNKTFMLIYMEGCGPCNAVRPEWKKLQNVLHNNFVNRNDAAIVDIDKDLIQKVKYIKEQPAGFPTILYITNKGENIENYENSEIQNKDRSIDSFIEWIKLKIGEPNISKGETINIQNGGKSKKKRRVKRTLKSKRKTNKKFSKKKYYKYGRNNRK